MLILAIDCAVKSVSIALIKNYKIVASQERKMERGQGEALVPMIEQLMKQEALSMKSIQAVAVSVGPGSFTGVRIGLAAARGIGLSLNIPVYGMTTLSALAYGLSGQVMAVIDTKRGDFYTQQFCDGKEIEHPCIRTIEDLNQKTEVPMVGLCEDYPDLKGKRLSNPYTIAEAVGLGTPEIQLPPEPIYLREADVSFPKSC